MLSSALPQPSPPTRRAGHLHHNFSGGPGALPEAVLTQLADAVREVPEVGLSLLGVSHRSDWFREVVTEAERLVRTLLGVSDRYHVLFLQGGSSLQFSMIPMLLLRGRSRPAEYLQTGYWSGKSIPDARREGEVRVLWDGASSGFHRLPGDEELSFGADAAYLHYVSNETVEGLQFHRVLGRDDVPRVCDMSSDFLSRPMEAERFALLYAHSQKNLGPAGVTVVVLRDDLLAGAPDDLHSMLDYRPHVAAGSIYNTPPVFAIYATLLVLRWLHQEIGGVGEMASINRRKAADLYRVIDDSDGFYRPHAEHADRSEMNVAFRLPSESLERRFLSEAEGAGLVGLNGHRSLGGIRASIYNAVTPESVATLCGFMAEFERAATRGRGDGK
jgi:phosphoserine aminotransferase